MNIVWICKECGYQNDGVFNTRRVYIGSFSYIIQYKMAIGDIVCEKCLLSMQKELDKVLADNLDFMGD